MAARTEQPTSEKASPDREGGKVTSYESGGPLTSLRDEVDRVFERFGGIVFEGRFGFFVHAVRDRHEFGHRGA